MLQRSGFPGDLLYHRGTGDDRRDAGNDWPVAKTRVYNIEEFDPDPFMEALNKWGLPWQESFEPELVD